MIHNTDELAKYLKKELERLNAKANPTTTERATRAFFATDLGPVARTNLFYE